MANEFDEYEEIETAEDTAWKPEHDFTLFTEEAESSDAIPFDEDLSAALDAEFESVLEVRLNRTKIQMVMTMIYRKMTMIRMRPLASIPCGSRLMNLPWSD